MRACLLIARGLPVAALLRSAITSGVPICLLFALDPSQPMEQREMPPVSRACGVPDVHGGANINRLKLSDSIVGGRCRTICVSPTVHAQEPREAATLGMLRRQQ